MTREEMEARFKEIDWAYDVIARNPELAREHEAREKARRDACSRLCDAWQEGYELGLREAKEELARESEQSKREIIRNMAAANLPMEKICRAAEVSLEEAARIIREGEAEARAEEAQAAPASEPCKGDGEDADDKRAHSDGATDPSALPGE